MKNYINNKRAFMVMLLCVIALGMLACNVVLPNAVSNDNPENPNDNSKNTVPSNILSSFKSFVSVENDKLLVKLSISNEEKSSIKAYEVYIQRDGSDPILLSDVASADGVYKDVKLSTKIDLNTSSVNIIGLEKGVDYVVSIVAVTKDNTQIKDTREEKTSVKLGIPSTPANVKAEIDSSNEVVTLTWNASTLAGNKEEIKYDVFVSIDRKAKTKLVDISPPDRIRERETNYPTAPYIKGKHENKDNEVYIELPSSEHAYEFFVQAYTSDTNLRSIMSNASNKVVVVHSGIAITSPISPARFIYY